MLWFLKKKKKINANLYNYYYSAVNFSITRCFLVTGAVYSPDPKITGGLSFQYQSLSSKSIPSEFPTSTGPRNALPGPELQQSHSKCRTGRQRSPLTGLEREVLAKEPSLDEPSIPH